MFVLLLSLVHVSFLLPLPGSPSSVDKLNDDEFMINHGVTQQEIEEFHRASNYFVYYLSGCNFKT